MTTNWKDDLCELLFPASDQSRNEERANELKFQNRPKSIFKFRSINDKNFEKNLNDINETRLWLSSPNSFNDPYDCFFTGDFQKTIFAFMLRQYPYLKKELGDDLSAIKNGERSAERLFQHILAKAGNLSKENLAAIQSLVGSANFDSNKKFLNETVKICCFSQRNDSIPMWAHYADEHQGFCVEYDLSQQPKEFMIFLYPVVYSDRIVDVTKELMTGMEGWGVKPVIIKSKDWSYEEEWRYIRTTPPYPDGVNIHFIPIKALYLGPKISGANKKALIAVANAKAVPVYQMRLSETKYGFEPISL